ncbi:MAG TPA: molybdopterin-dependent oxidoreductase [Nitrospinota bacterium]|nr:molybdopterin-dependent oxidoreductase [Nitrospinota bacterium]
MPTFTLNGKEVKTEAGKTILQAAVDNGVKIPHFCYHPHLSIDGCCRMCLVEVEKIPKLTIACNTPVAEGMVVRTNTEKVLNARKGVMEFQLINHPLDCPICDQAGECRLQKYTFEHGITHSRFRDEKRPGRKRFKIGPHIVFDEERCILCRRCVRFCREVSKTDELAVFYRGDKSIINTYPGTSLDNNYSLNTVDLCPVGALTSADFRFQVRVWFLEETKSVCPGCSNNCSIRISHRRGKVYRILPRKNMDVNKVWMCDKGRFTHKEVASRNRLIVPLVKKENKLEEVSWDEAYDTTAEGMQKIKNNAIGAIASPNATNEEFYLFNKLIKTVLNSNNDIECIVPSWEADDLLVKKEKAANPQGARELGVKTNDTSSVKKMIEKINKGNLKALYIIGNDILENSNTKQDLLQSLSKLDFLVLQDTHNSELSSVANVVLPSATFAEKEGTFTNINGFVQKADRAVPCPAQAKPDLEILSGVAKALDKPFDSVEPDKVMDEISKNVKSFKNISYEKLGENGIKI